MKPVLNCIWIDDTRDIHCFDQEAADRRVLAIYEACGLEPDWPMIDAQRRLGYSVSEHLGYFKNATGLVYEASWLACDDYQLRVVLREW